MDNTISGNTTVPGAGMDVDQEATPQVIDFPRQEDEVAATPVENPAELSANAAVGAGSEKAAAEGEKGKDISTKETVGSNIEANRGIGRDNNKTVSEEAAGANENAGVQKEEIISGTGGYQKNDYKITGQGQSDTESLKLSFWKSDAGIGVIAAGAFFIVFSAIVIVVMLLKKRKNIMGDNDSGTTASPGSQGSDSNIVRMINTAKKSPVRIARVHDVGRRSMQQDSFGLSDVENRKTVEEKGILAIVADGMGGLDDGDKMSQLVVVTMLQGFDASSGDEVPSSLLFKLINDANDAVNEELGDERIGQCGSTVVSVIIKDKKLYYLSVGDSHIYVYRKGVLTKINTDHNYAAELDEKARNGEISLDEAALDPQRSALTSYIGIGDLELIDYNEQPIALEYGDRVLLMSDGVYGTIYDEGIREAMNNPLGKACAAINEMINAAGKPRQDNYTCVVLEITDRNE